RAEQTDERRVRPERSEEPEAALEILLPLAELALDRVRERFGAALHPVERAEEDLRLDRAAVGEEPLGAVDVVRLEQRRDAIGERVRVASALDEIQKALRHEGERDHGE